MALWTVLVILAGLTVGVVNIGLKVATVKSVGMLPIGLYFFIVAVGLAGYGIYKTGWSSVAANLTSPDGFKYAAAAGVAGVVSNVLLYTAMTTAPAGLGFTLFNVASTFGSALLGVLLLKEVITPVQAAGVAMAILSVVLMTWKA